MWDFNFDHNKILIADNNLNYNFKDIKNFFNNFNNFIGEKKKISFSFM